MWEFQKQQGITPILGCLPMFLQMPIWIALWSALNTHVRAAARAVPLGLHLDRRPGQARPPDPVRHADSRCSSADRTIDALNVLPILLAVVFYLQQKIQPKPPTMTPEQEQQQKIMQWMMRCCSRCSCTAARAG